jgi:hypothetical protein
MNSKNSAHPFVRRLVFAQSLERKSVSGEITEHHWLGSAHFRVQPVTCSDLLVSLYHLRYIP